MGAFHFVALGHHLPPNVVRSLCSGARYSLGPNGLPPIVVTHSTALMQFGRQKRHFELHPFNYTLYPNFQCR